MKPEKRSLIRWAPFAALALWNTSVVIAQEAGLPPGSPRTVNERVLTETQTPPTAASDARSVAEGQVPAGIPTTGGAGVPGPQRGGAMDPAMRLGRTGRPAQPPGSQTYPDGMDVAILVEHAIGMAIDGSTLRSITESAPAGQASARMLLDHSRGLMTSSQTLLGQAAADGRGLAANPVNQRFHAAANQYIQTLVALEATISTDNAQVALVNHAVKEVLEADHIRQMGRTANGSVAIEQLLKHATLMKAEGSQMILRLAGNNKIDPAAAPSVVTLALRGRDVLDAAEQASLAYSRPVLMNSTVPNPGNGIGPNPGRFQDTRAQIIGGTYGTGSQQTGTTSATNLPADGGLPRVSSDVSPVPNERNGTTGSTGGLSPH